MLNCDIFSLFIHPLSPNSDRSKTTVTCFNLTLAEGDVKETEGRN